MEKSNWFKRILQRIDLKFKSCVSFSLQSVAGLTQAEKSIVDLHALDMKSCYIKRDCVVFLGAEWINCYSEFLRFLLHNPDYVPHQLFRKCFIFTLCKQYNV